MIITIDGPTASGKTSISRGLAKALGFNCINSGNIFRAFSYIVLNILKIPINEMPQMGSKEIEKALEFLELKYDPGNGCFSMFVQSKNIDDLLKSSEMDKAASVIGTNMLVREAMKNLQRQLAEKYQNIIAEGRDAGTVVFPNAEKKFYLTALPEVRAKRWQADQRKRGNAISLDEALSFINERDVRDSKRTVAPLTIPDDGIVLDNSDFDSVQDSIDVIVDIVKD